MARRDEYVFPVIQPSSKVSTDFFFSFCSVVLFVCFLDGKIAKNSHIFSSGTPPRGKRRVWFADEILNKQSESAPTTPVRGHTLSPLMTRALGRQVKSPAGSPQIRRALRPHGTNVNVGPPKNITQNIFVDLGENESNVLLCSLRVSTTQT